MPFRLIYRSTPVVAALAVLFLTVDSSSAPLSTQTKIYDRFETANIDANSIPVVIYSTQSQAALDNKSGSIEEAIIYQARDNDPIAYAVFVNLGPTTLNGGKSPSPSCQTCTGDATSRS